MDTPPVPIIVMAGGKGGVGKTTVAVNLGPTPSALGARVGLVDTDSYDPDVPRMMGLRRREDASPITVFSCRGGSPGAAPEQVAAYRLIAQHACQAVGSVGQSAAAPGD